MTKFSRVEVSPGEYLTRTSQPPEPKLLSSSLPSGLAFLRFPRTGMPIRIGTYGTHGSLNNGPFVRHPGGSDGSLRAHPGLTVARIPSGPPAGDLLPRGVPRVQRHPARERAAQGLGHPIIRGGIPSELNAAWDGYSRSAEGAACG